MPRRQAAVMVRLNNVRMRSKLILLIQLLCTCTGIEEPQQPPPPSPLPQKQPVECGRLGHCSEPTGLRDPDELHEVRTGTMHSPQHHSLLYMRVLCISSMHALCMRTAPSHTRDHRCGAAPTSRFLKSGDPFSLAALCGEGRMQRMRAGRAHETRPSPRPRPSAKT